MNQEQCVCQNGIITEDGIQKPCPICSSKELPPEIVDDSDFIRDLPDEESYWSGE